MSTLSVIQPISAAIQRTKWFLFEPFRLRKWLQLGVSAFLMGSAQASVPSFGDTNIDFGSGSGEINIDAVMEWLQEYMGVILLVGPIVLVALIVVGLLITWLSSRGRFMLLDNVVRNRGAIAAPWREYRREGNSLFRFRVYLGLLSLIALVGVLGFLVLIGMADIHAGVWGARAVAAVLIGGLVLLAWVLAMVIVAVLLMDFVVPIMYLRRIPVLKAWKEAADCIPSRHIGVVVGYLLTRILLNNAIFTLSSIATFLTCCIAFIPYVGSVMLLPFTIFQLTYPLAFLEQLGPEWQIFSPDLQTS